MEALRSTAVQPAKSALMPPSLPGRDAAQRHRGAPRPGLLPTRLPGGHGWPRVVLCAVPAHAVAATVLLQRLSPPSHCCSHTPTLPNRPRSLPLRVRRPWSPSPCPTTRPSPPPPPWAPCQTRCSALCSSAARATATWWVGAGGGKGRTRSERQVQRGLLGGPLQEGSAGSVPAAALCAPPAGCVHHPLTGALCL